jgi:hypothetical protein
MVFIQRFLFIITGVRIFDSIILIKNTTTITIAAHQTPNHINPNKTAGIQPNVGHMYGIISNNHSIIARDNLLGISIQNNDIIHKARYIVIQTYTERIILDFNQIPNFL